MRQFIADFVGEGVFIPVNGGLMKNDTGNTIDPTTKSYCGFETQLGRFLLLKST